MIATTAEAHRAPDVVDEGVQGTTVGASPAQIRDYQIHLPPLGEGTFGTVYRATYRGISERALKVFKPEVVDLPAMARELEKLSSVAEHHGIVTLHDFDLLSETPYYVMGLHADETLDGTWKSRTLNDLCGRVEVREAARLIDQIAEALAYLHRHQIVHCDLKPTNVMLTDDVPPQIKICDFGQSRASQVTGPEAIGTPLYSSPEQLLEPGDSAEGRGFKWDVYSFGVLAYKLVTGKLPRLQGLSEGGWEDLDATIRDGVEDGEEEQTAGTKPVAGQVAKLLFDEEEVVWPPDARIDARRKAIITRCLSLDAASRPADMREVRNEISRRNQERRATRSRNLALLFAAVGSLALLMSARAFTEAQRARRAIEAEQAARREAEELVNFIIFDLQEKLRPLGRLELLEHIAENAGTYFSSLSRDQRTVDSLRSFAAALEGRGAATFSRGDYEEAVDAYQKAFNIYDQLIVNGQGNDLTRFRSSQAEANLARSLERLGERPRAIEHLEAALAVRTGLMSEGEGEGLNPEMLGRATATLQRDLATLLADEGRIEPARVLLGEARVGLAKLATMSEAEERAQNTGGMLRVLLQMADLERDDGRWKPAKALYEEVVQTGGAFFQEGGKDFTVSKLTADGFHGAGEMTLIEAERGGDGDLARDAALSFFRKELILRQRIRNRFPAEAEAVLDLAECHFSVARCYEVSQESGRSLALTNLQRAINALESLRRPGDLAEEIESRIQIYRGELAKLYEMDE